MTAVQSAPQFTPYHYIPKSPENQETAWLVQAQALVGAPSEEEMFKARSQEEVRVGEALVTLSSFIFYGCGHNNRLAEILDHPDNRDFLISKVVREKAIREFAKFIFDKYLTNQQTFPYMCAPLKPTVSEDSLVSNFTRGFTNWIDREHLPGILQNDIIMRTIFDYANSFSVKPMIERDFGSVPLNEREIVDLTILHLDQRKAQIQDIKVQRAIILTNVQSVFQLKCMNHLLYGEGTVEGVNKCVNEHNSISVWQKEWEVGSTVSKTAASSSTGSKGKKKRERKKRQALNATMPNIKGYHLSDKAVEKLAINTMFIAMDLPGGIALYNRENVKVYSIQGMDKFDAE